MQTFQRLCQWLCLLVALQINPIYAETLQIKPFVSGSYQQMLNQLAQQPFMLVVWSIDCSSCLKDMALLNKMHQKMPNLKIIMLATDGPSAQDRIEKIIATNQLHSLENWNYAEENTQKLQYEIDPNWFGELPRTYFFNNVHEREGISGVLTEEKYQTYFAKILK